jgi:hypothetical protein
MATKKTTETPDAIVVFVKESGLPKTKADIILKEFKEVAVEVANGWIEDAKNLVVNGEEDIDGMHLAREKRLLIKSKRIWVAETHKRLKADAKAECDVLDFVKRTLTGLCEQAEDLYEQKEKFAELKQLERFNLRIKERMQELVPFPWFVPDQNLIGNMDDAMWKITLDGVKKQDEDQKAKAKEEAEFSAMWDAAYAEDRVWIRAEKERLQKILDDKQKTLDKVTKKADDATATLKEITNKEAEDKKADAAQKRKERAWPDRQKLSSFAELLLTLRPVKLQSEEALAIEKGALELLKKTAEYIKRHTTNLGD